MYPDISGPQPGQSKATVTAKMKKRKMKDGDKETVTGNHKKVKSEQGLSSIRAYLPKKIIIIFLTSLRTAPPEDGDMSARAWIIYDVCAFLFPFSWTS